MPLIYNEVNGVTVVSLFEYRGLVRELILRQKTTPSQAITSWFARLLLQKVELYSESILIVPGHPFKNIHFIERIALEVNKKATSFVGTALLPFVPKNLIYRKLFNFTVQKKLNKKQRVKSSANRFGIYPNDCLTGKEFWLMDDVFTTGQTMLGIQSLLQKNGAELTTCLTLAYTPLLD